MKLLTRPIVVFFASCSLSAQQPAEQQPTHVPVEAFTVPEGLEVTVWATSPLLFNPTNMDVDQHGRIWVTEGVNYRGKAKRRKEGDRVVVLEDTDNDGRADKSTVFVQEEFLVSPLGIAVFDNKVVVSQPPDMIVYTDVDRNLKFDPKVDKREVLLTGFQGRNHDHSLHSITAGPDGKWYWNSGNCGAVFTDKSGKTFRITSSYMDPKGVRGQKSDDGHVYVGGFTARMDPDGSNVEIIGHNYRNSYEQVVTSFGDVFQSDNDDPPACRVSHVIEYGNAGFSSRDGQRNWRADQRRGQDTSTAEWRQDDPGTMPAGDVYGGGSPTGVAFYENGALDKEWRGLLLTCEPARNVVFGYKPVREGAGFKLERMDWMTCNPEHKFNGGDFSGRWDGKLNTQFRPSDVMVGADGAIYVSDWFDGRVGGHQTLDNSLSGTIYRVAPKGFKSVNPQIRINNLPLAELSREQFEATAEGICTALKSPAVNVRNLAVRRLNDGFPADVASIVDKDDVNPFLEARGYWAMANWGKEDVALVELMATSHTSPSLRLTAFRALSRTGQVSQKLLTSLSQDQSPAVRAAVATSLRDASAKDSQLHLVEIAKRFDGKDRSYLDALGIGCTGKQAEVYWPLRAMKPKDPVQWQPAMSWITWRLGSPAAVRPLVDRIKSTVLTLEEREHSLTALAFIKDKAAMNAMVAIANDFDCALTDAALLWCVKRMGNEWQEFGLAEILKNEGIYDPEAVVIQPVATPTSTAKQTITAAQVLRLHGNAKAGSSKGGTCITCHKIGKQGIEFGPDIVSFAKTQSLEAVVEAILHPSKTISHGYEGHTVETKDGNIDGIVLSRGNPVMVQSQGGLLQMIPKNRVTKIRRRRESLMWPSQLNGLDAQGIADLIAYLKTL